MPLTGSLVSRVDKILSVCRGKSVLHLGCADYPFSMEQYKAGNLLHQKLTEVAKAIVGVDLSAEGIAFLASLGYNNLVIGNVEKLGELRLDQQFDVVVATELLEHLHNPGMFFSEIGRFIADDGLLILSVPNAHAIKGTLRVMLARKELVHPDHLYYFSQAVIAHFCKPYGLKIGEVSCYMTESRSKLKRVISLPLHVIVKKLVPYIGDGLIFVVEKKR